jgi:four helix bundle protein
MKIKNHEELDVFQQSFKAAVVIFELSRSFPKEERYSLTDQIRRSSRSVCANISEAFRKRYYQNSFVSKIIDSEAEAAETQVWIKFSLYFSYINLEKYKELMQEYDNIIGKLVMMRTNPEKWSIDH